MKKYEFSGFFAISGLSFILLLIFMFSNINNFFYNIFMPINNSLWEISKLMFSSILIYSIIEYFIFGKEYDNFIFSKVATLFIGPAIFILSSYLIDLAIGNVIDNIHVLLFVISIGLSQYLSFYFMQKEFYFNLMNAYAIVGFIVMMATLMAYSNPKLNLNAPIFRPMDNYENRILYNK